MRAFWAVHSGATTTSVAVTCAWASPPSLLRFPPLSSVTHAIHCIFRIVAMIILLLALLSLTNLHHRLVILPVQHSLYPPPFPLCVHFTLNLLSYIDWYLSQDERMPVGGAAFPLPRPFCCERWHVNHDSLVIHAVLSLYCA